MRAQLATFVQCIRFTCLVAASGIFMLAIPAAVLAAAMPQGEDFMPGWEIIGTVLGGAALLGSGFLMFAAGWPKRLQHLPYRAATAILLLAPTAAGIALLRATDVQFPHKGLAAAFTAFTTTVLLLCFTTGLQRNFAAADQAGRAT